MHAQAKAAPRETRLKKVAALDARRSTQSGQRAGRRAGGRLRSSLWLALHRHHHATPTITTTTTMPRVSTQEVRMVNRSRCPIPANSHLPICALPLVPRSPQPTLRRCHVVRLRLPLLKACLSPQRCRCNRRRWRRRHDPVLIIIPLNIPHHLPRDRRQIRRLPPHQSNHLGPGLGPRCLPRRAPASTSPAPLLLTEEEGQGQGA